MVDADSQKRAFIASGWIRKVLMALHCDLAPTPADGGMNVTVIPKALLPENTESVEADTVRMESILQELISQDGTLADAVAQFTKPGVVPSH